MIYLIVYVIPLFFCLKRIYNLERQMYQRDENTAKLIEIIEIWMNRTLVVEHKIKNIETILNPMDPSNKEFYESRARKIKVYEPK